MANIPVIDGLDQSAYLEATGAGTDPSPYRPVHEAVQATHDDLNANANLQVGNADVANGNPVPVSDASGSLTVDQPTHDNLNANANIQVGNSDVGAGNPVPISDNSGSLTVDQPTHDNLNANANIQVGNADVSSSNPVPVSDPNTYSYQYTTSANMSGGAVDLTAAPASGKKIVVTDIILSAEAAMRLTLTEETSGTTLAIYAVPANDTKSISLKGKLKLPTADKKLRGQTSASGNVYITVIYYSEA